MEGVPNIGFMQALYIIWKEGGWVFLLLLIFAVIGYRYTPQFLQFWTDFRKTRSDRMLTQEQRDEKQLSDLRDEARKLADRYVGSLQNQINDLKAVMNTKEGKIERLEEHVRQCDATVASQGSVIGSQQGQIKILEATVNSLNNRVSSLTTTLTKLRIVGIRDEGAST